MLKTEGVLGRPLQGLLTFVLALGVLGVCALLGLSWRLSQGPLDVDWAARRIESEVGADGRVKLSIGHASLRWAGFADGPGRGLRLLLIDTSVADPDGKVLATAASLDLSLSMTRLLIGEIAPRAMAVEGLDIGLRRDAKGSVSLDLGAVDFANEPAPGTPEPTLLETLAELARPARPEDVRTTRTDLGAIAELRSIRVENSVLRLRDAGIRGVAKLDIAALNLQRLPMGGVRGRAGATLTVGAAQATAILLADLAPEGHTAVRIELAPVNARTAQEATAPDAATDSLDAAVNGVATMQLDRALHPVQATVHLDVGAGHLRLAGSAIGFERASLDAAATWDPPRWGLPATIDLPRVHLVLRAPGGGWPTTANASATLALSEDRLSGTVAATLDHLAFSDVGALWPAPLGGHLRPWMVPNMTAGTARDGTVKLGFEGPRKLSDLVITSIEGSIRGDDLTVWWVAPVPPVEQAQAVLTINNPKSLDIAIASARQGPIALKDGQVRITGLQDKDQFMALSTTVQGGVPDVLALLNHPKLHLLSRKPIPMRNPAGSMVGRLNVDMMLKDKIAFEDVHIQASTRLTGVHLGGLVAGRDLDRGDLQLETTSEMLHVAGTAAVAGIPSDISVDMDFRPGGPNQVVQRAQAEGRASAAQLTAAGLDTGGIMGSGTAGFTARWQQRRDGTAEVGIAADLRNAGLSLVGWKKSPGQPADAGAVLALRGDRMTGIEGLHAQGPGMMVEGRIELVGTRPLNLVLDRIVLGKTQGRGQVLLPASVGEPIRATISGSVLDLADALASKPDPGATPGSPWIADITFDRVLLSGDRGLTGIVAHAESDGRRIAALRARSGGAERAEATIKRVGNGRHLAVTAEDGGALLRAADMLDTVHGGHLVIDGTYDDSQADSPLTGTTQLSNFTVTNGAALGKLLQAVTIYGVADALNKSGLAFSKLIMPFRWDGAVLDVHDTEAFSASLGLTAQGRLDTKRKVVGMRGTIVPLYVLNSMLGRIPVVGRLFSSERGGGLLAVDYSIRGSTADPSILVNPLSALTPGFLRGLFHILD